MLKSDVSPLVRAKRKRERDALRGAGSRTRWKIESFVKARSRPTIISIVSLDSRGTKPPSTLLSPRSFPARVSRPYIDSYLSLGALTDNYVNTTGDNYTGDVSMAISLSPRGGSVRRASNLCLDASLRFRHVWHGRNNVISNLPSTRDALSWELRGNAIVV